MTLLVEFFCLLVYFCYHLVTLIRNKSHSTRSIVLISSLVFSTSVRIILFLPPQVPYSNTIMVIDMFAAPLCYFTAVSALLSQWYDVFVLSKWCGKFEKKYMLIKRFTLGNLLVNLILWALFAGIIAISESFKKDDLLSDLLLYDLTLSTIILISIITIGGLLKNQIKNLMNGNSINFTNWVVLMILFTLLRFLVAAGLYFCQYYDIFIDDLGWYLICRLLFFFVEFNLCEILSMVTVYRTERITCKLFNVSIASTFKLSTLGGSSMSLSNDLIRTSSMLR